MTSILLMTMVPLMIFSLLVKTPIILIILLILLILTISLFSLSLFSTPWISFLLFMTTIGGLLILFVYMISIFPNQKQNLSSSPYLVMTMILSLFLPLFMIVLQPSPQVINIHLMAHQTLFMTFSVSYLFLLLFMIAILIKKKTGPLRSQ